MEWLIAHMWAGLGIAALAGLSIGWAVRGLGRKPTSFYTAPYEREVEALQDSNTGLRETIDRLQIQMARIAEEAKQPVTETVSAVSEDTQNRLNSLHTRLEEAKGQILSLSTQLEETKAEQSDEAVEAKDEEDSTAMQAEVNGLNWRNSYLEARIRYLESRITSAPVVTQTVAAEPVATIVETAPEVVEEEVSGETDVEQSKIAWQNRYLQTRLRYMEEMLASATPAQPAQATTQDVQTVVEPENTIADELSSYGDVHDIVNKLKSAEANFAELQDLRSKVSKEVSASGRAEQELARLRWRNRYLEGRLNYLENDPSVLQSERGVNGSATEQGHQSDEPVEVTAQKSSAAIEALQMVAEGSEKRPQALDGPRAEGGDDLTAINGIGDEIARVLNEIGVYHYDQIANWSPEEVAWVDGYLRFDGRVAREDWMSQAREFISEAANA